MRLSNSLTYRKQHFIVDVENGFFFDFPFHHERRRIIYYILIKEKPKKKLKFRDNERD